MNTIKTTPKTIDDYIAAAPAEVQGILQKIRLAVKECAPAACEKISYGMPAFTQNGVLVYFAACKNHIGFYPTADGLGAFRDKLSGYKTTKGAIQFPYQKPIPYRLIKEIVAYRVGQNAK